MEISRASARLMIGPRTAKIEEKKKSKDNENDTPSRISQLEISREISLCLPENPPRFNSLASLSPDNVV